MIGQMFLLEILLYSYRNKPLWIPDWGKKKCYFAVRKTCIIIHLTQFSSLIQYDECRAAPHTHTRERIRAVRLSDCGSYLSPRVRPHGPERLAFPVLLFAPLTLSGAGTQHWVSLRLLPNVTPSHRPCTRCLSP